MTNKNKENRKRKTMKRIKSFDHSHPTLYLIATPIGNLGEFSKRAIETISEMDLIAAEDTRNTLDLLHKFNLNKPCVSLREHNEVEASTKLISEIKNGKKGKPFDLITASGNLLEVFKDVQEVGNDVKIAPNGMSSPSVLIKKIAVAGQ